MGKLVQSCNIQLNILTWIGTLVGGAIEKIDTEKCVQAIMTRKLACITANFQYEDLCIDTLDKLFPKPSAMLTTSVLFPS